MMRPDPASDHEGDDPSEPAFFGRVPQTVEGWRVTVPRVFLDALVPERDGRRLVVVHQGRCLWLVTERRFRALCRGRETVGEASLRASLDGQGRITLTPAICRAAGIEREVVFVGVDDRIELWSPQADPTRDDRERLRRLAEELLL